MTREEFLSELLELMQRDDPLTLETPLADVPEWDSLSMMTARAFLDAHFSVRLGLDEFKAMRVVGDIAKAAGVPL